MKASFAQSAGQKSERTASYPLTLKRKAVLVLLSLVFTGIYALVTEGSGLQPTLSAQTSLLSTRDIASESMYCSFTTWHGFSQKNQEHCYLPLSVCLTLQGFRAFRRHLQSVVAPVRRQQQRICPRMPSPSTLSLLLTFFHMLIMSQTKCQPHMIFAQIPHVRLLSAAICQHCTPTLVQALR